MAGQGDARRRDGEDDGSHEDRPADGSREESDAVRRTAVDLRGVRAGRDAARIGTGMGRRFKAASAWDVRIILATGSSRAGATACLALIINPRRPPDLLSSRLACGS